MSRINCHSAFKHYEMFHSRCGCGGGSYGSIFNTTYNIDYGNRGGGGFWSGFGAGLGQAFGNLFGGFLGGGFGMGNMFGGFGMPMFGGFSMPMFGGGFGNFWGGGGTSSTTSSTTSSSSSSSGKGVTDNDNKYIERYQEKIDKLKSDAKASDVKDLFDEISEKYKKPVDSVYEGQNKLAYKELLDRLKAKYPNMDLKIPDDDSSSSSSSTSSTPIGDGNSGGGAGGRTSDVTEPPSPRTTTSPAATASDDSNSAASTTPAAKQISDATTLSALPAYGTLTNDADKKAYLDKFIALAKSEAITPGDLRTELAKLPADVRAKVKQAFYKDNYTNVKPEELTEALLKNLKEVIDDSEIGDFHNITVGTPTKSGSNLWTIPMTHYNNGTEKALSVDYIQVSVNPEDGEIIFHGKQSNQHYVLQKDKDGKLHLMQYKYHQGYGTADVTS